MSNEKVTKSNDKQMLRSGTRPKVTEGPIGASGRGTHGSGLL